MIQQGERLRKVSEHVFAENDPPEDRRQPLEWRRHFTPVHFPLTRVKIVTSCTVNETDYDWNEKEEPKEEPADPLGLVTPNMSNTVSLRGIADPEQTRDSIVCLSKADGEKDVYFADFPKGAVQITIREGAPAEGKEKIPDGVYYGTAFRYGVEQGDDHIHIELIIPQEHLQYLVAALRADEQSKLDVLVDLLGFTYEVDDALREHYHPRTILIPGGAPCFAIHLGVTSAVGEHQPSIYLDEELDEDDEGEDFVDDKSSTPEELQHQELMHVLLSFSKQMNGLVIALWGLVIVVAVFALARM